MLSTYRPPSPYNTQQFCSLPACTSGHLTSPSTSLVFLPSFEPSIELCTLQNALRLPEAINFNLPVFQLRGVSDGQVLASRVGVGYRLHGNREALLLAQPLFCVVCYFTLFVTLRTFQVCDCNTEFFYDRQRLFFELLVLSDCFFLSFLCCGNIFLDVVFYDFKSGDDTH